MTAGIVAVVPQDREMVQLYSADYQPGRKPRSVHFASALCGASLPSRFDSVPVAEAADWLGMRFCRPCLGHAVVLADVKVEALKLIGGGS